jgi:hypothetical protein
MGTPTETTPTNVNNEQQQPPIGVRGLVIVIIVIIVIDHPSGSNSLSSFKLIALILLGIRSFVA